VHFKSIVNNRFFSRKANSY